MTISAIRSVHFTADQKLIDYITERVNKLDKYHPRIIEADVTLKLENTGQIKDKICEIKLYVPGQVIVSESTSKKFETACDNVVSNLKRKLIRVKERMNQH